MATKRGLCPYCKNTSIQHSYFLVNPEATSVYCGTNMHQIDPQIAIRNYDTYMLNMIEKADDTLNVVCNPYLAYQEYADVIEIDDSYVQPYIGRILCLVYMSKVRKSHLNEARQLLQVGFEKNFTKSDNYLIVFPYLRRIVHTVEEYLTAVRKRLTFRQYFYDTDCIKLYLLHVKEARDFEASVFEVINDIKKKFGNEKFNIFLNYMDEKVTEKERFLKDYDYISTSGRTYKCQSIRFNNIELNEVAKKPVDTKTSRYRMATLDMENKKLRYIKDEIFKDYTAVIRAKKVALFWYILFYVLTLGSGVCIYIFRDTFQLLAMFIAITAVLFILGTIFLVLNLSWNIEISKKRRKLEVF